MKFTVNPLMLTPFVPFREIFKDEPTYRQKQCAAGASGAFSQAPPSIIPGAATIDKLATLYPPLKLIRGCFWQSSGSEGKIYECQNWLKG